MKNILRKFAPAALILCLICSLALVACKRTPDVTPDNPPESPTEETKVVLSDSVLTLDIYDTATLTVREGGSGDQKWTSNNIAVATVDGNGTVTAVTEGTAEIEVTTSNTIPVSITDTFTTVLNATPAYSTYTTYFVVPYAFAVNKIPSALFIAVTTSSFSPSTTVQPN